MSTVMGGLISPAAGYIKHTWVEPPDTNFLYKHVLARGGYLILVPASVIAVALDIIIGMGAAVATVLTLTLHNGTARYAFRQLNVTNGIIACPYKDLLLAVNPEAKFGTNPAPGILAPLVTGTLGRVGYALAHSDGFFERHVFSRLTIALLAPAFIIARLADAIIGVVAAPLSVATFGMVEELNGYALHGLEFTGVIFDLYICAVAIINPWAGD